MGGGHHHKDHHKRHEAEAAGEHSLGASAQLRHCLSQLLDKWDCCCVICLMACVPLCGVLLTQIQSIGSLAPCKRDEEK